MHRPTTTTVGQVTIADPLQNFRVLLAMGSLHLQAYQWLLSPYQVSAAIACTRENREEVLIGL